METLNLLEKRSQNEETCTVFEANISHIRIPTQPQTKISISTTFSSKGGMKNRIFPKKTYSPINFGRTKYNIRQVTNFSSSIDPPVVMHTHLRMVFPDPLASSRWKALGSSGIVPIVRKPEDSARPLTFTGIDPTVTTSTD